MTHVHIKLFGPLRDLASSDEVVVAVSAPATGERAFEELASKFPDVRRWRPSLRLAVNCEYVGFDAPLRDDDELALIPPVSGG